MNSAPSPAAELQRVMEQFTALSEDALRACERGDSTALMSVLDARDLLTQRAAILSRRLGQVRRAASGKGDRQALDDALHPVRKAAAEAERFNAALAELAQGIRLTIGEQLDRLRHDESAHSAYAATAGRPDGSRLDRVR